ncbi:FMRFamide receptor-like [Lineus longissimus]|uniref:FMRFamide receptor-like n=1 Tax=Lineus longissimus TaxID=88925 RepID=UPI002B4DC8D7
MDGLAHDGDGRQGLPGNGTAALWNTTNVTLLQSLQFVENDGTGQMNAGMDPADMHAIFLMITVLGCVVGILAVAGLFLNVLSMIVFSRVSEKSASIFLMQVLAAADSAFLISNFLIHTVLAVFLLSGRYIEYEVHVLPSIPYIASFEEVSRDFAVWMVVLVTFERYLAIYYPLKANVLCRTSATAKTVIVMFAVVALFNIPSFLMFQSSPGNAPVIAGFARSVVYNTTYYVIDALFNLVAPISLVLCFNFRIIAIVRLTRRRRFSCDSLDSSSSSNHNALEDSRASSVTMTLFTISSLFIVCELPHLGYLLMEVVTNFLNVDHPAWWKVLAMTLSHIFQNINSFINFFIYIMMARKFRSTIRVMFWNCPKRFRRRRDRGKYPVCTSFV